MAYTTKDKERTIKYIKEHLQRIEIRFNKAEYETIILPAINESGLPVSTYIKEAIQEKIDRERNSN